MRRRCDAIPPYEQPEVTAAATRIDHLADPRIKVPASWHPKIAGLNPPLEVPRYDGLHRSDKPGLTGKVPD